MTDTNTNNSLPTLNIGRRRTDAMMNIQPIEDQSLISFEGKTGIFVPLTKDDTAADVESQRNLMEVVKVLRKRIKELELENSDLKVKLDEATKKTARTPDDFVTAITHSVDSLQAKLSKMSNPSSNFVVRDFKIDTKVFVDVTPLGTIDYRFIQPGDNIDPQKLTNISLTLSPTPKPEGASGNYTSPDFTPFEDIDEIQGIGDIYKNRLKEKNIYTVSDLLHAGTRVRSKVELASLLEVDHRKLGEWLGHAQLLTIKGIDGRAAEILFDLGIDSLEKLALQPVDELTSIYNQRVGEIGHKSLNSVTADTVSSWVKAAQTYTGKKPQVAPNAAPDNTPPPA